MVVLGVVKDLDSRVGAWLVPTGDGFLDFEKKLRLYEVLEGSKKRCTSR